MFVSSKTASGILVYSESIAQIFMSCEPDLAYQDEALHAELVQVKTELKEAHAQIDALRCVQEQMDQFKMKDRTSHDYQVMLMDSSK